MNVAIVEDNEGARKGLERDLAELFPSFTLVGYAENVIQAIELFKNKEIYLVFMDVNLPDGTCFDILQRLDYKKYKIIFTSAYDKYAINAFRYSAVDYLMKPIKVDEFKEAINKVITLNENQNIETLLDNASEIETPKKLALTNSDGTYVIELADLVYIEANGNYSNVYIKNQDRPLLISKTMKSFESLLKNGSFIRTHHTFMVNTNHIHKFVSKDGGYLILKNGKDIPVSQRKRADIVKFIETYS